MNKYPILEEKLLTDLREYPLRIPEYQRPYKWRKEHVIKLLDDLYYNIYLQKDLKYRVGSLILNKKVDSNDYEIVDGQQRLTTFSMILHFFKNTINDSSISNLNLLQKHNYKHKVSKDNIVYNYQFIKTWFASKSFSDYGLRDFLKKIETRCEFVIITVDKDDEAFQLFDSQNSRGKELFPHDLLKAFHLREMDKDGNTEQEKQECATKWEDYILDKNQLLNIMNNHLFRIRSWSKGEKKYNFSKSDLDEFKGLSLSETSQYNYELAVRIIDGQVENSMQNKLLKNFNIAQSFPFQINMPIINGKRFFEYVFHYIELKKELFEYQKKDKFHTFYQNYCLGIKKENGNYNEDSENLNYSGSYREGDKKVRNLFENISFFYVDRFGPNNFEKVYFEEFYKNSYQLRLQKKAINEGSILNSSAMRFFTSINNTYKPIELHNDLYCNYQNSEKLKSELVKNIDLVYKFITGENLQNG